MSKIIEKYIDLSNLTKIKRNNQEIIDWNNCSDKSVYFKYNDIEGYMKIVNYSKDTRRLTIKYHDYFETDILCSDFKECKFRKYLGNIVISAPWMIPYFQGGYDEAKLYTKSSHDFIKPICPMCGKVKNEKVSIYNIYRTHSIGCVCGDGYSFGHKYIFNLLEQINVDFEQNKTLKWCKFYNPFKQKETDGEYDLIIEDMKLIIEIDGGFHRNDRFITKEESEFLDKEKERLSEENGYKVIRIFYDDINMEIKKYILNSKLNELFDLTSVNWNKCEEFALKNIIKEICSYWNNRKVNESTTDLGKIFKIDRNTILYYLKKGTKLGWCDYNPIEEKRKSWTKPKISRRKKIEVFKNETYLGTFNSASELESKSEELFGVKLLQKNVRSVCSGDREYYKNYIFKYVV